MQRVLERIINLLAFLLTAGRPVTAEEIRFRVAGYDQESDEAFRRTFERDKDLVRRLGIPLEMQPTDAWEVEQGYVIPPDEYALADPGLDDDERAALWAAARIVRLGGTSSGTEAIFKLGGAPGSLDTEPLGADLGSGAETLGEAFAAIGERREVRFRHRGRTRRVRPFGLVHRRGHWYLTGEDLPDGHRRTFRVDRIERLTGVGEPGAFDRPAGYRASEAFPSQPWEAGSEDVTVTVRFDPEVAWWARRQLSAPGRDAPGGAVDADITVANIDAFLGWLVGFEDGAEILEPPEIRERYLAHVRGPA